MSLFEIIVCLVVIVGFFIMMSSSNFKENKIFFRDSLLYFLVFITGVIVGIKLF